MKLFYNFVTWICLSGIGILSADEMKIHEHSGETVTIICFYSWASTNIKYFCRDPCKDSKDILVKSDQSPTGRYTLKDSGEGTFTVNITDLQESDSGIYWCGVDRYGFDTYQKVNLTVSNDSDTNTNRPTTPKPAAGSQSSTAKSSFSTSSASGDITASSSSTGFKGPVHSPTPAFNENGAQTSLSSGPLMFTAVGLTVIFIIFGAVLCIWNNQKKNLHSSKVDAEIQGTTHTTETAA
ncbi:CMRF35-like molecule 5 [Cyprinus carpio]|uniref:CMRF35-like molecule 5 n=1 Tax=Cyprinus carpio TaxID=7962 RepID=A0A9Q9YL51_CYPCA|nr:CMRF35-like molecule 5 [Cyprinus carpio]